MAKDTAFLPAVKLSFPSGQGINEDRAVCVKRADVRLIAAFDGCGGIGGRRYPQLQNRTGASIASRLYADVLREWFKHGAGLPRASAAEDLTALFSQASREFCARYLETESSVITGSMVHTLPSTAAIAVVNETQAALYWAGNTRGYLLTEDGLTQLTTDDYTVSCDTFDSLRRDTPISNYLCADQPFALHAQTIALPQRGMFILATDGAYQALSTPMHFEAMLLDTLALAASGKQWKKLLRETLHACAADDVTLILQPFGFAVYEELAPFFDKRRRHMKQAYILPADQAGQNEMIALRSLWEMYRKE
jgi:serine/threonine protein phosphatase PrpC